MAFGKRVVCWLRLQLLLLLSIALFFFVLAVPGHAQDDGVATRVRLEEVASGFSQITDLQHAPGEDDWLFVVEQSGLISFIDIIADGSQSQSPTPPTPTINTFLDIRDQVRSGGERGLLGLAFHPDYETNGFFFVNYIWNDGGDGCGDTRISRFQRSSSSAVADRNSELVVAVIPQPYCNHNGGQLLFGPDDGYLYIGTGDGGSGDDPLNSGQDLSSLLGKMLRVDVNNVSATDNTNLPRWSIPPDNPFAGSSDNSIRQEIWLSGLRNPWRYCFDGDVVWIADVGQGAREEVTRIDTTATTADNNDLGWRYCEGTDQNFAPPGGCRCDDGSCFVLPVLEYGRSAGKSVTGGCVYRGSAHARQLGGTYFYADFVSNVLWGARENDDGTWSNVIEVSSAVSSPSTFGVDAQGELYVASHSDGRLFRIVPDSDDADSDGNCNTIIGSILCIFRAVIAAIIAGIQGIFG